VTYWAYGWRANSDSDSVDIVRQIRQVTTAMYCSCNWHLTEPQLHVQVVGCNLHSVSGVLNYSNITCHNVR
jgi:hypothetical protein